MRIISSFKDYYDNSGYADHDPKLLYVRETKEIDITTNLPFVLQSKKGRSSFKEIAEYKVINECIKNIPRICGKHGVICFCGKLYPFYQIIYDSTNPKKFVKTYFSFESMFDAVYSESFLEMITQHEVKTNEKLAVKIAKDTIEAIKQRISGDHFNDYTRKWNSKRYLEHDKEYVGKNIGDAAFIKADCPIILCLDDNYYPHRLILNPRLNELGFVQKLDTVSCFQEIEMYLGNNLAKQIDPSVNFSDELKAEIAGFDKFSFRKQKK